MHEAEQVVADVDRLARNIRLTVQPCGHVHTASDDHVHRLWLHIHEMTADVASGYHGHAVEARPWTTEEIVREAHARVAGTATEGDSYPVSSSGGESAPDELARLREGLHKFRYALDSRAGRETTTDFIREMLDAMLTDPGEPCDRDQQYARAEQAEATVARVRAEVARIRSITPTWGPVADLIEAALDGAERPREQRERPAHPDGTPYSYYEITAEGWGFCDGCGMWSTASQERPHQCPETHMQGPIDGKEATDA
ncbi:hypothetical protein [Streptomyces ardesiacus]|uniref:hypothetical protein n=1 Tax=Streptomyces ardesiacus TaxID=285564 RepID=UPI002FDB9F5D